MNRRRATRAAAACALLIGAPAPALAHLVTTGMGPVYDGIGHLLLTPEDLVPAMALALLAGMRGRLPGRRALFLLPPTWLLGGLVGTWAGAGLAPLVPALSLLLLGALLAADLRLPTEVVAALTILLGLVHGYGNGVALREGPGLTGLLGIAAMLFVLVALGAALSVSLQQGWRRVTIRVAGSWVCASGLLMVGWLFRESIRL